MLLAVDVFDQLLMMANLGSPQEETGCASAEIPLILPDRILCRSNISLTDASPPLIQLFLCDFYPLDLGAPANMDYLQKYLGRFAQPLADLLQKSAGSVTPQRLVQKMCGACLQEILSSRLFCFGADKVQDSQQISSTSS